MNSIILPSIIAGPLLAAGGCATNQASELRYVDSAQSSSLADTVYWASDDLQVTADAKTGLAYHIHAKKGILGTGGINYGDLDRDGIFEHVRERSVFWSDWEDGAVNIPTFKVTPRNGPTAEDLARFPGI